MNVDTPPVVPCDLEWEGACWTWSVVGERGRDNYAYRVCSRCVYGEWPIPYSYGPFATHQEAKAVADRLNAAGIRRTIEICQAALRQQNARLIKAYAAQGMTMPAAIHRFIEERIGA